jgi:hypothetical protein
MSLGLLGVPVTGCTMLAESDTWLLLALASAILFVAAAFNAIKGRLRPDGSLLLTAHGLTVETGDRAIEIQREDILAGYELPDRRAILLQLTGGRELLAELANTTTPPERVLEHLGVSVQQRALTAPLRGQLGAFTIGLVTLVVSLFGTLIFFASLGHDAMGLTWPFSMLTSATIVTGVLVRFGWPKVIIGIDGVRVTGLWSRPFVPYSQIERVTPHAEGIQILRKNGSFLSLSTIGQSSDQITALTRRIEQGMQAHDAGSGKDVGQLARQGRPLPVWKENLRRIALAPAGFRDQALSRDDFEKLLLDARAPAEQRIGAALALRAVDPDAKTRIRIAASASANEALRSALEACSTEVDDVDDSILERATAERRPL